MFKDVSIIIPYKESTDERFKISETMKYLAEKYKNS